MAHNQEVAGANPAPATMKKEKVLERGLFRLIVEGEIELLHFRPNLNTGACGNNLMPILPKERKKQADKQSEIYYRVVFC